MMMKTSGFITAPRGFRAAGICCGIKAKKPDLALLVSDRPAAAAGTFTTNSFRAAPVLLSGERLKKGSARAIVVNSGCANACTGEEGRRDAERIIGRTASLLGIDASEVLAASTGRIGPRLPVSRIEKGIESLVRNLSPAGGGDAAAAILTTDSCPKEAVAHLTVDGRKVTVGGMAKGAGMIHPGMATMLAFITTDASIAPGCLRLLLGESVESSFNRISVDGDMSTNDSVFALANGLAGNPVIEAPDSAAARRLASAVDSVTAALAEKIVRDGEGATKFVRIVVRGARDSAEAARLSSAVARSLLFKCAVYGEKPNWGRVLSALGSAGVELDPKKVTVLIQGKTVFDGGAPLPGDGASLKGLLSPEDITVEITVGKGYGAAIYLTCDLTPQYVEINST